MEVRVFDADCQRFVDFYDIPQYGSGVLAIVIDAHQDYLSRIFNSQEFMTADKRVYAVRESLPYSGIENVLPRNQSAFDLVVTCQKRINPLLNIPTVYFPVGHRWVEPITQEELNTIDRKFSVSWLQGKKMMSCFPGHVFRRQVTDFLLANEESFSLSLHNFPPEVFIPRKEPVFDTNQFSIIVENHIAPGYLTEKLQDPISRLTIPIYRGAPDASEIFDARGMFQFTTIEELSSILRSITPQTYEQMYPFALKNFHISKELCERELVNMRGRNEKGRMTSFISAAITESIGFFK